MSNNKQCSSVEWLIGQLKISTYWNTLIAELEFMDLEIDDIIEQAKAMHKEEIKKAMSIAFIDGAKIGGINYESPYKDWDQYYNETFNTKEK